jgi:hypothetical protein
MVVVMAVGVGSTARVVAVTTGACVVVMVATSVVRPMARRTGPIRCMAMVVVRVCGEVAARLGRGIVVVVVVVKHRATAVPGGTTMSFAGSLHIQSCGARTAFPVLDVAPP